jgi:RNA polymerase sigma-70 factor, ECF subfamily
MARDPLAHPEESVRRLFAYVAYRIGPGPDAEDAVSETIERALRYRSSYDERKGSPAAWLTAIASHVLADAARARQAAGEPVPEPDGEVEDFSPGIERRLDLHEAVALLDGRSRELLALRYGADLKAREIAALLGLRTNAVEVALHRAIARLRETLDEGPPPVEPLEAPAAAPGVRARIQSWVATPGVVGDTHRPETPGPSGK